MSLVHIGVLALAFGSAALAIFLFAKKTLWGWHEPVLDFTGFWTAARSPLPYDAQALTKAQQWALPPGVGLRPFAYPPSTLLLIKPLAMLQYRTAIIVWTALGLAAFGSASLMYGRVGLFGLLGPMVSFTALTGQISLLIGAAVAGGVSLLEKNEIAAGILFGIAAAAKPQLLVLMPIGLIAARQFRSLSSAAAIGTLIIGVSFLLGPHLWLDWLNSLDAFQRRVLTDEFRYLNMAPGLWFAPLGIGTVWFTFRCSRDPAVQLVSLVAGTCCCTPYMMAYDLVGMAPGAAVLLFDHRWQRWPAGFFGLLVFWMSPLVCVASCILDAARPRRESARANAGHYSETAE